MHDPFVMAATERRRLADDLDGMSDTQWTTASLCAGWQVRDVVAHLVWPTETSLPRMLLKAATKGFKFDRLSDQVARGDGRSHEQLAAILRTNADSRFKPPGMGPEAPLTDVVVHGLDIRWPLALGHEIPEAPSRVVLDFLLSPKATRGFVKKGLVESLRFETSDVEWSRGSGATVRGSAAVLMLSLSGRNATLDELAGEGAREFRQRCEKVQRPTL